jgi:hypothetical protein
MNDRPTATELVEAARQFLEAELLPTITDSRLRFQTLVAINVLAIVARELPAEEAGLRQEWSLLRDVLEMQEPEPTSLAELRQAVQKANAKLCEQIRAGEFDEPARFGALSRLLRPIVVRKLEIANPRYLASVSAT